MSHDLRTIVQSDINSKQLEFYIDVVDVINEDVICDKLRLNREHTSTVSGIEGTEFIVNPPFRVSGKPVKCEPISNLHGMRVLIADDDVNTCMSVVSMLNVMGMKAEWIGRILKRKPKKVGVTAFCSKPLFMSELREVLSKTSAVLVNEASKEREIKAYEGRKLMNMVYPLVSILLIRRC